MESMSTGAQLVTIQKGLHADDADFTAPAAHFLENPIDALVELLHAVVLDGGADAA